LFYAQQKGLNIKAKIINGRNNILSSSRKIPPTTPKTNAKIANIRANKKTNGEKTKTITIKSTFNPSINNSIAIKISMVPPKC